MSARILVVDDAIANIKLLEAQLTAEYFDVTTATSGAEALEICSRGRCDIVLLDVMMPGMDGFEVCRRLKSSPLTAHVPVIMVTALDQPSDRVAGLEAGADDFLTKPVDELTLVTRIRSLARLKMLTDELAMRAVTSSQLGLEAVLGPQPGDGEHGRILLVDDRESSYGRMRQLLAREHEVAIETDPHEAVFKAAESDYDLVIVSLDLAEFDGLRVCSQLRSFDRTRTLPILVIAGPEDRQRLVRGLDLGVNDYLQRPIDRNELLARVRTQIRRKRFSYRLRDSVQLTVEMAITDSLTGLNNRRYFERHLATMVEQSASRDRPFSLLVVDIDHFKAVNDTYGHDVGDEVLREFAQRLRRTVRGIDLACRFGGEEFVIAMPDTEPGLARVVAERIRARIAAEPFAIGAGTRRIGVTASIGVASRDGRDDTAQAIVKRADEALYRAKRDGRNRVVDAAA
jgi:two-component system cell cycle response regulator